MTTKKKSPKSASVRRIKRPADEIRVHGSPRKKMLSTPVAARKELHLGMHFIIAGSAIAVMMMLGMIDHARFSTQPSRAADALPSTIGIEHQHPLKLSVLVARKVSAGYVSLISDADETIHVSVPSLWKRSEVTGAQLKDITQDIPVFGFTRWSLPSHAGIKFTLPEVPSALFFDSTSETPTSIDLQTINLTRLRAASQVVLLQSQALVKLWGENEE